MSLLSRFEDIIKNGRELWEISEAVSGFSLEDYTGYEGSDSKSPIRGDEQTNKLILGDNLKVCKYLAENGYSEKLKLIYADPPFFSKTDYKTDIKLDLGAGRTIPVVRQKAYKDSWEHGMEEYLTMLAARFFAFKELLSNDGSMWIHLDWHAVHYVKVILDEIIGEKNLINEVIWNYKSGGVSKRRYSRKHDTLLFYSKSKDYYFKPQKEKSYNRGFKPYRFKGVKEYKDEMGWYTLVNMKDVWQINMVGRTSAERTGYATQKPEALLSRIIESCTEDGDICADFFGGSGTVAAAADKMGRMWISCDIGRLSTINSLKRMLKEKASFEYLDGEPEVTSESMDVDVFFERVPASDMRHVVLELKGYKFGSNAHIPVNEKDMPLIKEVEQDDWLQLIDYLAVDFDFDGRTFKPNIFSYKEGGYIDPKIEKLVKESSSIAVKAIDIFGNTSLRII